MERWFSHIRYVLLGLFLVSAIGVTAYEWWFVWPAQKCEKAAAWWDPKDHQCLDPLPIWRITGRPPATGAAAKPRP